LWPLAVEWDSCAKNHNQMSTAPSNSTPKNPEQSLKPTSPPKKSDSLKQTTLVLSVAMVGDNTKVSALSNMVSR